MATITLTSSNWDVGQLRITYTALNGTLKITEIEGKRSTTRSWIETEKKVNISVGGTSKTVSLSHYVDFNTSWVTWGATDTSWTGLTGTSISISTTMTSDTTSTLAGAKFSGNATMDWSKYTIAYNANGGSLGSVPSTQTKTHGTALTITSEKPTRSGYTFGGWALSKAEADDGRWYYSSGSSCGKNEDLTLYAVWSENKLTVNYYSNYATSAFADALNTVGSDKNVKVWTYDFYYDNDYSTYGLANYSNSSGSVYMTRTGYTGTGNWVLLENAAVAVNENEGFSSGQELAELFGKSLKTGNASINVYAEWKINTYTITYNSNGGTGSMSSQSVDWGEGFTIPISTFKREGYKCIGYNVKRSSDNKWYVTGQKWQSDSDIELNGYTKKLYIQGEDNHIMGTSWTDGTTKTDTFTFYAVWEISGVVYIDNGVSFDPYLAYIDNGSSWDLYLAYIDNGSEWNIIS